ncbi:MAG: ribosomal protein S18-alanine N-acetyltransferase [Butyricicoccus sp.]|nr:ribosomal protein S18-alanine N-acetyltransferase [Butyricicoccus sp.]
MKIKITKMQAEHIPALAMIEKQCFQSPWSESALAAELEQENSLFLVAEGPDPLGYVGCKTVLDEGYITNVAVRPDVRRHGIARRLLRELQKRAQKQGLSFITLEVRISNAAAIALYEKAGYISVGTRKAFYHDPKEDAMLMTYFLDKGPAD